MVLWQNKTYYIQLLYLKCTIICWYQHSHLTMKKNKHQTTDYFAWRFLCEIMTTFKDEENTSLYKVSWSKDHFVKEKTKYCSKLFKIQISKYFWECLSPQQNRRWKIANLSTAVIVILHECYYQWKMYTNCNFYL